MYMYVMFNIILIIELSSLLDYVWLVVYMASAGGHGMCLKKIKSAYQMLCIVRKCACILGSHRMKNPGFPGIYRYCTGTIA